MSLHSELVILISIIITCLSLYLYNKAAGTLNLTKLNPVSSSFYALLFLSLIGTSLMYAGLVTHHMDRYVRHGDSYQLAWMLLICLVIIFPLVVILTNKICKYKTEEYRIYIKKELKQNVSNDSAFFACLIATLVCLLGIVYTFKKIGIENTPIYGMIFRDLNSDELDLLRNLSSTKFPGNSLIKNIFAILLPPVISYFSFINLRKTREKRWLILFIVLFLASCLMSVWDLQKAPIIAYIVGFYFIMIYYDESVKPKHLIVLIALLAILIVLMYRFIVQKPFSFIFSLGGPINRIMMTSAMGLILHLEVYTYRTLPLKGASLTSFLGRLAGFKEPIRSARDVMTHVNYVGVLEGSAGVYNGLFLGEAYANWGVKGIWIAMLHVPLLFALLQIIMTRIEKNPFTLTVYSYLTVRFLLTLHGGYTDYIFNSSWLIVIVVILAMYIFCRFFDMIFVRKDKK